MTKKVETCKDKYERAEKEYEDMTTTQDIRERRKKLKIDVATPRSRINPPQNTNQNQIFVTNFSDGKRSSGKMDTEEIMTEKKTSD